jgi:hypothetical protein
MEYFLGTKSQEGTVSRELGTRRVVQWRRGRRNLVEMIERHCLCRALNRSAAKGESGNNVGAAAEAILLRTRGALPSRIRRHA